MKIVVSAVVALIVGVAVGYMFNPSAGAPEEKTAETKSATAIADNGDAASLKALRARIKELEEKLAERESAPRPEPEKVAENGDNRGDRRGPGGFSPREWRERMQKEDPERYTHMTNRMARWRNDRLVRAQKKVDFLSSIDTSRMSAGARKTHEDLQNLIAKREEMEQRMHEAQNSDADISREEMHSFFQEALETDEKIRDLNAKERENLMVETVKSLGFSDTDSDEIAGVFQEIIENTDSGWGFRGPRHHGPGRGRGGR